MTLTFAFEVSALLRKALISIVTALPSPIRLAIESRYYRNLLSRFDLEKEPDLGVALRLIEPGDTVVDIGASVGLWTLSLAKRVGIHGRVVAVEPIPQTYAILERIVRSEVNLRSQVSLISCAISNTHGQLGMTIPRDDRGIRNHYLARIAAKGAFTVEVKTIDEICESIPDTIRFIKIDTEGHELPVICGGLKTLQKHMPILCVEISTDPNDKETEGARLLHLLSEIGYAVYILRDGALRILGDGKKATNYFFIPRTSTVASKMS